MADIGEITVRITGDASDLESTISGVSGRLSELEQRQGGSTNAAAAQHENAAQRIGKSWQDAAGAIDDITKPVQIAGAAAGAGLALCAREAINFDDSFASVKKTVDGTPEHIDAIKKSIIDMSTTGINGHSAIPLTTAELNELAAAGGQLGIDDKTAELADECDELRERAERIEQSVDSEAYARSEADAAHAETLAKHEEKIVSLEETAHTHENAEILDAIDGERVAKWDSIEGQVTQEEFDGACFSFAAELLLIWRAMGINAVDGGLFGQEQADDTLDGGDFDGEPENEFDCGDLAPLMCCCGSGGMPTVIDGGDYSNTTGAVIDGGDYSNTTGAVIDGGNYS